MYYTNKNSSTIKLDRNSDKTMSDASFMNLI